MSTLQTKISVENSVLHFKNKKVPLISGEFHYWRNIRENWPAILSAIKEMGLKVIATYVPWNYHELAPGKYDFTGKTSPQKDLKGFIELVRENGLYLIIRPGPYIYSEWPFGGVPERASRYHRLEPEFLKMSKDYIDNVCRVIVPAQITNNGNVILVQADNEPYPPIESFGDEIGCFGEKGVFKDWLKEKYQGNIDLLNEKWRSRYKSFDETNIFFHEPCVDTALPMAERLLPYPEYYTRYADTFEFVGWYGTKIVETVAGWMRESGINVPIFANGWSPLYQDFTGLSNVVEMVGLDIYPLPFIEGNIQTADAWFTVMDTLKLAIAEVKNGNVFSAEFQSGLYPIQLVGYLPPEHFKFVASSLIAKGLKGWNWYMLVNRDNWSECPINEWGRPGGYFPIHKEIVAVTEKIEPWNLKGIHDADLFVYKPHRVISPGNFQEIFTSLEEADIDYTYFDAQANDSPQTDCLVYAGANWLERNIASKLLRFVQRGGTLIVFNQFPIKDECGREFNPLGFVQPDGVRPVNLPVEISYKNGSVIIEEAGHLGSKVNFFYYKKVEGEPIYLTLSTKAKEVLVDLGAKEATRFIIGYLKKTGNGKIIHIGSNSSPLLLRLILKQEKKGLFASCSARRVLTNIHRHKNGDFLLFVTNKNAEGKTVDVALNTNKLGIRSRSNYLIENITESSKTRKKGEELKSLSTPVREKAVTIIRISEYQ